MNTEQEYMAGPSGFVKAESEIALLSSLLVEPSRIVDIDIVSEDFAIENHRDIYGAILTLGRANNPIDVISVSETLDHMTGTSGWLSIVGQIAGASCTPENIEYYSQSIREASLARRSKAISEKLSRDASKGQEAIDEAIRGLMGLAETKDNHECSMDDALSTAVDKIDKAFTNKGNITGIPSGLTDVDSATGGWQDSDLIIVGARPAIGKTAFMLNLVGACNVVAGVISGEQPRDQMASRMIAMNGRVNAHKMRLGNLEDCDWPRITAGTASLQGRPIRIMDKGSPTIDDVRRQARVWHHKYGLQILFADYLQKIQGVGGSLREKTIDVACGLKDLAKELDIPVISLAQVNRGVESRPDKRPQIADLLESGAIEQEADLIAMLYRDEVYNQESPDKGVAEIIFRKNRHGPIGTIRTVWHGAYMRFDNFEDRGYGN